MLPALLRTQELFAIQPWASLADLKEQVDRAIYDEIARRIAQPARGEDVLSMMLEAHDEASQAPFGARPGNPRHPFRESLSSL